MKADTKSAFFYFHTLDLEIKKAKENKMAKKFKPHMMYKKCKEVMAETFKDHLKLKKKGYDHKKDKSCEATK